jgi:hypothetical protein
VGKRAASLSTRSHPQPEAVPLGNFVRILDATFRGVPSPFDSESRTAELGSLELASLYGHPVKLMKLIIDEPYERALSGRTIFKEWHVTIKVLKDVCIPPFDYQIGGSLINDCLTNPKTKDLILSADASLSEGSISETLELARDMRSL